MQPKPRRGAIIKSSFRKLISYSLLFGGITAFTSCEDTVQVDLPQGQTLLVVDAFINNQQSIQTVRLTNTSPYFSNVNVPAVTGAIVSLTDVTSGKTFSFSDLGTGDYDYSPAATDSFGIIGHQYRLDVKWNGYNYYANSQLNRTTEIDTIVFVKNNGPGGGPNTNTNPDYFPYIFAKDQANGRDYYWIKAYKNGKFFNNPQNINVVQDAGGEGTDGLSFIPPNAFFQVTPRDEAFKISNAAGLPDLCKIEIYSVNAATYEFLLQAQAQMTNSSAGLFATTPENVRTNILASGNAPKAIGWFNIGAIDSKTLPVK